MRTIVAMMQMKFIFLGLLGLGIAVYNTDWSTDALLFIDPNVTPYAVVLTMAGIFGTLGCWLISYDMDLAERNYQG